MDTMAKIARCPGPDTAYPQGCTCLYNPCLAPFHIFSQGNGAPDDLLSLINSTDSCCFPKDFPSLPRFFPSFLPLFKVQSSREFPWPDSSDHRGWKCQGRGIQKALGKTHCLDMAGAQFICQRTFFFLHQFKAFGKVAAGTDFNVQFIFTHICLCR